MKKFICVCCMSLFLLFPTAHADKGADRLIDVLLGIGLNVLQGEQGDEVESVAAAEVEQEVAEASPQAEASDREDERTLLASGRDMLGSLLPGKESGQGWQPFSEVVDGAVMRFENAIDAYKEKCKEEGREYTRELVDIIVIRVLNDPKIERTIYSFQALCLGVIAYLTLVTLVVMSSLKRIARTNRSILAELEALRERLPQMKPTQEEEKSTE